MGTKKPNGYWTKEKCQEEAIKYKNKKDFRKQSGAAYTAAQKNNWLNDICEHMQELIKPVRYWTKEKCHVEALKYTTRSNFAEKSSAAYKNSIKYNYDVFSHMQELQKPNGYWTYEKCKEEALKYNTKKDFAKNSSGAYNTIRNNKWLDIFNHFQELQKPRGYWTKEKCQEEALKYTSKNDYRKNSATAYTIALKNNWIYDICGHMSGNLPRGYWTKEKCQEEALKYINRTEFKKSTAYTAAQKNDWLNDICGHMQELQKPHRYWTKEKCHVEALKYTTRNKYRKNSNSSYNKAKKTP